MINSTTMIVLSRAPYRETALLLTGLSPDSGKLALVLHGGQSGKNPVADLFRELEVAYESRDGDTAELFTAQRAELLTAFDALADAPRNFTFAGRIASFLLKNSVPDNPLPFTYDALRGTFARLAAPDDRTRTLEQLAVIVKLTFLYENGLLPDPGTPEQAELMENIVSAGIDDSELPECPAGYWKSMNAWLDRLIEFHHLKR